MYPVHALHAVLMREIYHRLHLLRRVRYQHLEPPVRRHIFKLPVCRCQLLERHVLHNRLIVVRHIDHLFVQYLNAYVRELLFQHADIVVRHSGHVAVPEKSVRPEIVHSRAVEDHTGEIYPELAYHTLRHCDTAPGGCGKQSAARAELVYRANVVLSNILVIVEQCTVKIGNYQYIFEVHNLS